MTGAPHLVRVGIRLSERVLSEYPDQGGELASASSAIGKGYETMGDVEAALSSYRRAWEFERARPTWISDARLNLALLIVNSEKRDCAAEAIQAIAPRYAGEDNAWPLIRAQKSFVRASIAAWRGDALEAARHAEEGLAAAGIATAFPRHPGVGVVGPPHTTLVTRLKDLASLAL